jgi:hypothetical protein
MTVQLTPQTDLPNFIIKNGELLVRKMYEVVKIDGVIVSRDLPLPGQQPEYMTEQERIEWHKHNQKLLLDAASGN